MAKYMIGIDLGATNAKVGLVSLDKKAIVRSLSAPLSNKYREPDAVCDLLCSMTMYLLEHTSPRAESGNSIENSLKDPSKSKSHNLSVSTNTRKTVHVIKNGIFIPPTNATITTDHENNSSKTVEDLLNSLKISCNLEEKQVKLSINDIEGLAVGCPGQIESGIVRAASNFPTWKNVNLVNLLEKASAIFL